MLKAGTTTTTDPCSLELSSGHHRGKRLWLPLLLERQDCERPKPEGRPPSGDQSGPKDHWFTTQRKQVALTNPIGPEAHDSVHCQRPLQPHGGTKTARDNQTSDWSPGSPIL